MPGDLRSRLVDWVGLKGRADLTHPGLRKLRSQIVNGLFKLVYLSGLLVDLALTIELIQLALHFELELFHFLVVEALNLIELFGVLIVGFGG